MNDESFFSKKGQRQIGTFIGQELLYDFLTGQLDEERKTAVLEFLKENKDAQTNAQKIQNGMGYADKLAQTQVSEVLLEKVVSPSKYSEVLMQKIRFEDWPPALKLGIEATFVAFGITVFAILIPWHKLMDLRIGPKEVVLTEIGREYRSNNVVETETTSKEEMTFPDEGAQSTAAVVAVKANVENKASAPTTPTTTSTSTTTTAVVAQKSTSGNKVDAPADLGAVSNSTSATSGSNVGAGAAATAVSTEEKRQGELYRGQIQITNVSAIGPKLVEKVQALGARKAGQVELGWSKDGNSAYFHFTMPASHYEELLAVFNEYGSLKIQKEKHERIMPQGILRIIITVDEKK